MLPTRHEIEGLIEIARLGSISRAARSLCISQPSLSQSLKKLETRVGSPLFMRHKAGVHLTESGKIILSQAQEIMGIWERSLVHVARNNQEISGPIRIGCHVSVSQYVLAPLLRCLQEEFPRLEVTLVHDLSRRLVDLIQHDGIDIALAMNPVRNQNLILRPLATDRMTFFGGGALASLEEAGLHTLVIEPSLMQVQGLMRIVLQQGISFRQIIETSSLDVCASLVRDDIALSILPRRLQRLLAPAAQAIPGAPAFADELHLVYRAGYAALAIHRTFLRRIEAVLKSVLADTEP